MHLKQPSLPLRWASFPPYTTYGERTAPRTKMEPGTGLSGQPWWSLQIVFHVNSAPWSCAPRMFCSYFLVEEEACQLW